MSRTLIKQIGKTAGYVAAPLALVLAIGLLAVRRFEWYIIAGGIVLLICLAVFAATNPESWQRALGRKRISSVLSGIIVIVALVGIIGLVNVLMQRTNFQVDLTSAKNFTISETSEKVLKQISQPFTATVVYGSSTIGQLTRATDLLNQFKTRNDKLTVQTVNVDVDVRLSQQVDVSSNAIVLFEMAGRRESASSVDEQSFTRTLLKLQNPEQSQKRVLIVGGHQEYSPTADQTGSSLQFTVQALTANNYQVALYNSATGTSSPVGGDPATTALPTPTTLNPAKDILLIAGPRSRYTDAEKQAIQRFFRQGGKAIVAYEIAGNATSAQPTNINDLLTEYGVSFQPGLVVETRSERRLPQNPTYLIPEISGPTELKASLQNANVFVLAASAVQKPAATLTATTFTPILQTSQDSYMKTKLDGQNINPELEATDVRGPLVVGAIIEEKARESVALTSTTPVSGTNPVAQTVTNTGQLTTKIVLLGSPTTFSDITLQQSGGNAQFFVNLVNYLNESPNNVVIPIREANNQPFTVNSSQSSLVFWACFLGLPLLILFLGLLTWWRRR